MFIQVNFYFLTYEWRKYCGRKKSMLIFRWQYPFRGHQNPKNFFLMSLYMYVVFYVVLCGSKASKKPTGPILFSFFSNKTYTLHWNRCKWSLLEKFHKSTPVLAKFFRKLWYLYLKIGLWALGYNLKTGVQGAHQTRCNEHFYKSTMEICSEVEVGRRSNGFLTPFLLNAAQPKPSGRF